MLINIKKQKTKINSDSRGQYYKMQRSDIHDIKIIFHPICPFSRQIRVLLEESELDCKVELKKEDYWLRNSSFLRINPLAELPVLIINESKIITSIYSSVEFLIDCGALSHIFPSNNNATSSNPNLIPNNSTSNNNSFSSNMHQYTYPGKVSSVDSRMDSNINPTLDTRNAHRSLYENKYKDISSTTKTSFSSHYINEYHNQTSYLGQNQQTIFETGNLTNLTSFERAKIRSFIHWFNQKFYKEALKYVIDEKAIKLLARIGSPDTNTLRNVRQNIKFHLDFINNLLEKNSNLVLDKLTIADIVAACHISVLDYLGEIDWHANQKIKDWYIIIKSRPSSEKSSRIIL